MADVYLSPRDTFGLFNAPKVSVVSFPVGVSQLAQENPDRVVLTLINSGTQPFVVSPVPPGSTTQGLSLSAAGGNVTFLNRDHGPLSQCAWFLSIGGVGGQATVIEVILERYPKTGPG